MLKDKNKRYIFFMSAQLHVKGIKPSLKKKLISFFLNHLKC